MHNDSHIPYKGIQVGLKYITKVKFTEDVNRMYNEQVILVYDLIIFSRSYFL